MTHLDRPGGDVPKLTAGRQGGVKRKGDRPRGRGATPLRTGVDEKARARARAVASAGKARRNAQAPPGQIRCQWTRKPTKLTQARATSV